MAELPVTTTAVTARAHAALPARSDVVLATRVWAWAALVRLLKHVLPLPLLVRLMRAGIWISRRPGRVQRLRNLALASPSRPIRMPGNCLDRSLALFRLLVASGASPHLVVGMRPEAPSRITGHVWVRLDGEALEQPGSDEEPFGEVLAFDPHGRPAVSTGDARGARG